MAIMPWELAITKTAARDLRDLSREDQRRVNTAFEAMRADPYGGDIKLFGEQAEPCGGE